MARERLYEILDEARSRRTGVYVTGPPGSGKSTLVSTWLQARGIPGIWYQVDQGDTDLATFFDYLVRASAAFRGRGQRPLPALTPEYALDVAGFSRRFFRLLFDRLPTGAALVLDNFQEVENDEFCRVIADAVEEVPPGFQMILISRRDAPRFFARSRANERMRTIGWDDLQLTFDEAVAVARVRKRQDAQLVRALHADCGGWAAGFTLMLEHGRAPEAAKEAALLPARETVFEYFASQVFDATPDDAQRVMLRCSVLPSFTISQAVSISDVERAAEILADLRRRQLFLDRRAGDPPRFQLHALYRDFLRSRLSQWTSAEELIALFDRAASLLEADDQPEDAFALRIEGRDHAAAERLTLTHAPLLLARGRWRTLREWIGRLPSDRVRDNPWLPYWLGTTRIQDDLPAARSDLRQAFDGFRATADPIGQMLCAAAMIRTHHFEYSTFEPMDQWVDVIDQLLGMRPIFPNASIELAVYSALLLAVTYRLPGHPRRQEAVQTVARLLDSSADPNLRFSAGFALVIHHALAHTQDRALPIVERMALLADAPELTALTRVNWWMFVGYFHHRCGDRDAAESALNLSDRIATENGLRQTEFISRCFRAFHCISWNDIAGAAHALDGLDAWLSDHKPMLAAQYHNARYFLEMARGSGSTAEHHARLALQASARLGAPFFKVAWLSHGAAALAMNRAFQDSETWIENAWCESAGSFLETYRPMMLATRAYAASLDDAPDRARELVCQLFQIAPNVQALSYLRTLPVVKNVVVAEALASDIEVPLAQLLVRSWNLSAPDPDALNWPWPVKIRTLGEFRLEVAGQPVVFSRKTPRKPIALLKAIVAMGGKNVQERRLIDAIWPDDEGDAASESFSVALHRLRKLLGHAKALHFADGLVSLDETVCWVDAWSLERASATGKPDEPLAETAQLLMDLYRGHFLAEEPDAPWAAVTRERLRGRFLRRLLALGRSLEADGLHESAADVYRNGIDSDELAEELYQGLMRCLQALERRAEAISTYRRLRQALSVTLGIAPSPTTQRLFQDIQA